MNDIVELLVDFIYPVNCVVCGENDSFLCDKCLRDLEYSEQICPECGEDSVVGWTHDKCRRKYGMDGLVAVYAYQDENIRKIVDEIKFGFNRELIKILIESMEIDIGEKFDVIVPIPLYFYRENWRGYNQAREIGRAVSKQIGVSMLDGLKRVINTKQQSLVKDRKERIGNIKKAFKVCDGMDFKGKKVLLVDDVFTSGASMNEACEELKKSGALQVWGLVLAH